MKMHTITGNVVVLVLSLCLLVSAGVRSSDRQQGRRRGRLSRVLRPKTTTPPTTIPPSTCMPTTGYDASSNWCYGTYCDSEGQAIHWDNFNCYPTTTTSPYPTTTPTTTLGAPARPGCYYQGQYYAPGTQIEKGEDRGSNWCWVVLCDSTGTIIHGDDFNCFPTTTSPTTIPPTTMGPPPVGK